MAAIERIARAGIFKHDLGSEHYAGQRGLEGHRHLHSCNSGVVAARQERPSAHYLMPKDLKCLPREWQQCRDTNRVSGGDAAEELCRNRKVQDEHVCDVADSVRQSNLCGDDLRLVASLRFRIIETSKARVDAKAAMP